MALYFLSLIACMAITANGQKAVNDHCFKDCTHFLKAPVCGTDHITYDNMCEFEVMSCLEQAYYGGHPRVKHQGECTDGDIPRNKLEILKHCNDICDESRTPICGSDGVVYDNKCTFTRSQCEFAIRNETLFPVEVGAQCPQVRSPDCLLYQIDVNDLAIEDPNAYKPQCPRTREYICGSNGRSFIHPCQMCAYMEATGETLTIVKDGSCLRY